MNIDRSWLKKHSYFKRQVKKKDQISDTGRTAMALPADELDKRCAKELTGADILRFLVTDGEIRFTDQSTGKQYTVSFAVWMKKRKELRS